MLGESCIECVQFGVECVQFAVQLQEVVVQIEHCWLVPASCVNGERVLMYTTIFVYMSNQVIEHYMYDTRGKRKRRVKEESITAAVA